MIIEWLRHRSTRPHVSGAYFPSTQSLLDDAKSVIPYCLTSEQRRALSLEPEPPSWCITMEKWPYQSQERKEWLNYKQSNFNPPSPNSPE